MSASAPGRVAIVSPELCGFGHAGGISTFIRHLTTLLLERGDRVTYVFGTTHRRQLDPEWEAIYRDEGIEVVQAVSAPTRPPVYGPDLDFVHRSEAVADALPADAEVVYFADWDALGLIALRRRRTAGETRPVTATVLHGTGDWVRMGQERFHSHVVYETSRTYAERYAIAAADVAVAPSQALADWLARRGQLARPESLRVLGYPFTPRELEAVPTPASRFTQVVYFGRLQTLKGFDLFVESIDLLARSRPDLVASLERVVFVGSESEHRQDSLQAVAYRLRGHGLRVEFHTDHDHLGAQRFLAENARTSLVCIPSLVENLPFTVIECSLVPGLNLICSNVGGIPEILGEGGAGQLFPPHARPLTDALERALDAGPKPAEELARYDYETANARWVAFHEELLEQARAPEPARTRQAPGPGPSLDVCVAYYNHGQYLPHVLQSLARQTSDDFRVTVIDDGSTDAASTAVFSEQARLYGDRGWRFVTQENRYLGAARNAAAALGDAPYLCFIDSDDVAGPRLVERFLAGMEATGDDCLACYGIEFTGDAFPYEGDGQLVAPLRQLVKPLGGGAATAIIYNPYGLPISIMRRTAFEDVGGYTEDRHIGYEDYELYCRLVLAGKRYDVIPEFLYFYRFVPSSMTRTISHYWSQARVHRAFEDTLAPLGLADLPSALFGQDREISRLWHEVHTGGPGARISDPAFVASAVGWKTLLGALARKPGRLARRALRKG